MVSSQEVRWFFNGGIEVYPQLKRWVESGAHPPKWLGRLGGKPDVYLVVPGAKDMGLKWREEQLQIKGLESVLGVQLFSGGHIGNVERWLKWSYEGAAIDQAFGKWFTGSRIVEVAKTRCLRKFRLNPFSHQATEVEAGAVLERGGCLEVTDLRVGGKAYCSVGLETFPNDSAMYEDFNLLANGLLEQLKGVELSQANSHSYPAWLQTL